MITAIPLLEDEKQAILDLLPAPGQWTDSEYLWFTDHTRRLVEFTDGHIEALPMPTDEHQSIAEFFFLAFTAFLLPTGGKVHLAALRLRVRRGKYREPDVLLVKSAKDPRRRNRYWTGADLTLEVVSPDKPERDLVDKRLDYAEGNVPEYWIVNPLTDSITVLRLENGTFVEHGIFGRGDRATSATLPGFSVDVNEVFDVDSPTNDTPADNGD